MFIDVLAILDVDHAKHLLVRNGFGEGIQAHFLYHWKLWKSVPITPQTTAIDASTTLEPEQQATEIIVPKIESKNNDGDDEITLMKIFHWGGKMGKTLIESYNQNNKLSELERANLCDLIINYCLVNDFKLNVRACRILATEIIAAFPNEIESAYHKTTNDRLITKYNYKQRNQHNKDNVVTEKRSTSPSGNEGSKKLRAGISDGEIQKAISKLNNDPSLTAEEIKALWRDTAPVRMAFIATASSSMAIYAKWKQYTEPLGYVFVGIIIFSFNFAYSTYFFILKIDIDFTEQFGEQNDICLQMDEFIACFIDYLNTDEHRGFRNEKCKEMWNRYDNDLNECELFC